MKRTHAISMLVITTAVVSLAACGSSSKPSSGSTTTTSATTGTSTSTAAPPPSSVAKPKTVLTLRLLRNAKLGKQILVTPAGKTLYLYVPDAMSTTSTVPAAIKANWPEWTAPAGTIGVGAGVIRAKVAVHKQADGVRQVAYNGHLLYTFIGDTKPGDVTGQGLGGVWYAVLATGVKAA